MIDTALGILASAVILALAMFARPTRARCPADWQLTTGIRPSGVYTCHPPVTGRDDEPGGIDYAVQPPGYVTGQIYCAPPLRPAICPNCMHSVACAR